MVEFFTLFFQITEAIAIYIVIGLFLAGVLHVYIDDGFIKKHLGKGGFGDVFKAALMGIPLPMCSCSVIPFSLSLQKSGASRGAVSSFFISTPMTGADSILPTYGIFGPLIAFFRVLSSLVSALLCGVLVQLFDKERLEKAQPQQSCESGCCCSCEAAPPKAGFAAKMKEAYIYAFKTLLPDIAKQLLIGLIAVTLITMFMPEDFSGYLSDSLWLNYLAVLVLAIPMYVCSISAIPIAMSLLAVGFSMGAAFVFLSAAPATNMITIGVVKKLLGVRSTLLYLLAIIASTLAFAFVIDLLFTFDTAAIVSQVAREQYGWIEAAFAVVLLLLLLKESLPRRSF